MKMSQDRFKAVKIVMQRAQMNGCPVSANKTTLYVDTVSGRKVFANEFQNKGDRTVKSVSVRILCFDEAVKLVGTIKNYEYSDMEIAPGEVFGETKYIACPSDSIQSFAVVVTNIEMEDDYYWSEDSGKVMKHYREPEIVVEMAPEIPTEEINDTETEAVSIAPQIQPETNEVHTAPQAQPETNEVSAAPQVQPETSETSAAPDVADEKADAPTKKPKNKKLVRVIVSIAVAALVIAFLICGFLAFKKYKKYSEYNRGAAYMANGNYDYAITVYSRLGNYMDSAELLNEAKLAYAQSLANDGSYEEAIAKFKELGNQEDKISECYDAWVSSLCSEEKYEEAMTIASTDGVTVSEDIMQMLNYELGKIYSEHKEYDLAIDCFTKSSKYQDSAELLKEVYYNLAMEYITVSNYDEALASLNKSTGYKDTESQISKVNYLLGKRYLEASDYEKALTCFEKITDYEDVSTLILKCYYEKAKSLFELKEYKEAMEYYKLAGEYEDSADMYNEALYQYLLLTIAQEVTSSTMELFDELPKNYGDSAAIIKTLNKYVDHVGTYKWSSSNDKEVNEKGGFEENVVVKLSYVDGEVVFTVDDHPVDLKKFAYESGTSSDTYTMLNTTTITRTFNGKVHYYKKIVE